ncbi:amidase [Actinomadura miaoliensis]|uniref:Amidase n=1 Tax=Actinomadura miaoliensis TaxID=430685 RepID=A0ABP7WNC7_9ACTN
MKGFFIGRTLADLGDDLRAGRTSAAALLERALESIDPGLNAFVTVDAEGAAQAARRADEELAAGADRGPLHGVPVAVKDIINVAGLPTGMGSALFDGYVAPGDAACVRLLREAGAVIVGKTTTHEFAYGASGDVSVTGPSRNPHDPARISGGSSGGSAVAVAAGMVPLALGTDTGGSVRIPAALCGIAGFKPAFGAIPIDGVFPLAESLDHVGVLAATPADCRTAYRVLTSSADRPAPDEMRMAWVDGMAPVDAEVEQVVRAAFAGLPAERLDLPEARRIFAAIQDCETYDVHADQVERVPDKYQPATLDRLERARRTPGWRYVRGLRERDAFGHTVARLLDRYDVLVLPTVPFTAPPIGRRDSALGPMQPALVSLTCPWNVARVPALSVPAGFVGGLPVGAQFIGRAGAEHVLFAAAERFQASRG